MELVEICSCRHFRSRAIGDCQSLADGPRATEIQTLLRWPAPDHRMGSSETHSNLVSVVAIWQLEWTRQLKGPAARGQRCRNAAPIQENWKLQEIHANRRETSGVWGGRAGRDWPLPMWGTERLAAANQTGMPDGDARWGCQVGMPGGAGSRAAWRTAKATEAARRAENVPLHNY